MAYETWFCLFLIRWTGCPLRKSEGMNFECSDSLQEWEGTVKKLGRCQAGWLQLPTPEMVEFGAHVYPFVSLPPS